jgi:U3 small nucleolar RNA-associated protein 12
LNSPKQKHLPHGVVSAEKVPVLDLASHPTGIRAVALSSDDSLACTVSKNVTQVWNVRTRRCIHTMTASNLVRDRNAAANAPTVYGLCATFLPGNAHVVVGTREGHLLLLDIRAGEVVFSQEKAHAGAIWSIDLTRSGGSSIDDASFSIVTGSADHTVKFWVLESEGDDDAEGNPEGAERPVLVHTRTLELKDDVIAVRYSHSADSSKRLVFVATLDNTIKVFFDDSLKLFLNLYGHSLPALAVDSSDDDSILATGGADKTVKIWGLDFGDTHRTMHGHEDSITDLRFVRHTHNFFTSSKDFTVRYWDGDRFEQILVLRGHSAEVNCLAVSRSGAFTLSGGMDRQIRVWERTKDIVFLEEERERALEQVFDRVGGRDTSGTASILERKDDESDDGNDNGEDQPQSEAAVQRSVLSVAAGDRLLEGLERADQELKDIIAWKKANGPDKPKQPNPLLLGLEPAHYVLWLLKTIKSAELEQSVLVLPLTHIERLVYYCTVLLRQGRGTELCSKVSVFLVKVHQNQVRL